jgi:hypothetical protein
MKKKSPQQAIKEKCKECIYDEHNGGTWAEQTENCTVKSCALYEFRPLTGATKRRIADEKFESLSEIEKLAVLESRRRASERLNAKPIHLHG